MRRLPPTATDEYLEQIASVLDDVFRIPGTQIRFGLDFIIGWIPGIGDALAGLASMSIIFAAWRRGAATVTLVRMVTNVALETVLGAIPLVGDAFHVVWKANRRNYRLLMREKQRAQDKSYFARDALFLLLLLAGAACVVIAPFFFLFWLIRWLEHSRLFLPLRRSL